MTNYKPLTELITHGHKLPRGYDTLGWKVVKADGTSYNGFQWPGPGEEMHDRNAYAGDVCPSETNGGYMIARNFGGARSGSHGNRRFLVLAYNQSDILGMDSNKIRVRKVHVVAAVDPERLFQHGARGYDLSDGIFDYMNLGDADFRDSKLCGASFVGTNLHSADFSNADAASVWFEGANLRSTTFDSANLGSSSLRYAFGAEASFRNADMGSACLVESNLQRAIFTGADLSGATVISAKLNNTSWEGARVDQVNFSGTSTTGANGLDKLASHVSVYYATDEVKAGVKAEADLKAEKARKEKDAEILRSDSIKPVQPAYSSPYDTYVVEWRW